MTEKKHPIHVERKHHGSPPSSLLLLAVTALLCFPRSGVAAPNQEPLNQGAFGIIDQVISPEFVPERAFVFYSPELGIVRELPAGVVHRSPDGEEIRVLAGAAVPLSPASEDLSFTFFLQGGEGAFSASPVKTWSRSTLEKNTASLEQLESDAKQTQDSVTVRAKELSEVDARLRSLRERASAVAGVDEIVDLKMELARLKGFGDARDQEQTRLKGLIEQGRQMPDPSDIGERRRELSSHLQDAARVTATAARLSARRKEAAKTNVEQKIALIKEMSTQNPEALAQELLGLRERRKALERELQPQSGSSDEF